MRDPTDVEIAVLSTEELTPARRSSIIDVCIAAHDEEDFKNLFTYIESGGRHFLAYRGPDLVSHAVVTTRWVQPEGHGELRSASTSDWAGRFGGDRSRVAVNTD